MSFYSNLLANLADNVNEDGVVRVLAYLMNGFEAPRTALEELVREGGADVRPILHVRPHKRTYSPKQSPGQSSIFGFLDDEDYGIEHHEEELPASAVPDLEVFDSRHVRTVLVEAKFDARLTRNQPNGYLNKLPLGENAALLFLSPSNRAAGMWRQIREKARGSGRNLEDASGWRVHSVRIDGSNHYLMLARWTDLMEEMLKQANESGASEVESSVQQLRGLILRKCGNFWLDY